MTIRKIREMSGLSQVAFGKHYGIPLSTLKGWETERGKMNHRDCPEYVKRLLERVVRIDFKNKRVNVFLQ